MDAERWQRLSPQLDALLALDAGARAHRLQEIRATDPATADDLAELLAFEDTDPDFLAEPVVARLPRAREGADVGPYRLERLLGEGGMGQVWLASRADGLYQRRVALKLLRPGLAERDLRLRFTRERQILALLEHAHIARLLDAGVSAEDQPYLALEYVDGEPITDWCRAREATTALRVRLFLQVCAAVSHAHANLIVHRDLKPSNILVTPQDEARLLDFGIAKLLDASDPVHEHTRTGLRAFTLHYAAPEQIRGEPVTTMTDVYSLGVVLYELLADTKPYRLKRNSDAEWEEAILDVDPQRPSQVMARATGEDGASPAALRRRAREVAGDLDNIVLKALAKRPELRYPSVEALAQDLQRWRDGRPVLARPQRWTYRLRKYVGRHRWSLASAAAVVAVLFASLGLVTWQARQALREANRAQAMQDFVVGLFENAGTSPVGAPLDVRMLLDTGAARGDLELAQQPAARAELLGMIARLRAGLGDYEASTALLKRQRAVMAGLADVPARLRLQSATDLGNTQRLLGQHDDCIAQMLPLAGMAQREEHRLPVQAAAFQTEMGRCLRAGNRTAEARRAFERALYLRSEWNELDDAGMVENLADLAGLHADEGDATTALSKLGAALALLRERVGPRHPLAIEILRQQCSLRRELSDVRAAERDCREGLAMAQAIHGRQHRATIDARRQLAALLVDGGRLAEAEAEFRDTQAWLVSRLGLRHVDVARNHNSLGIVAWERGDLDGALEELARAVDIWRRRGDPRVLSGGLFNEAMVLHEAGRDDEAFGRLQEALKLRIDQFGAGHGLVGSTWRLIGEVEDARGHAAAAHAALARAAELTRVRLGARHSHALRAQLALARFEAVRGDRAAMERLDALGRLPQGDHEVRKVAWRARAAAAALRCRGPRREAAQAEFTALAAALRRDLPEGGTVAREVAAERASCGFDAVAG